MKNIIRITKSFFLIVFILLIGRILYLVIASNTHNYEEQVWQPYQQGDSLFFFNNIGDTVRWGIFQVDNRSNPSDPLLPLSHRRYSTTVSTTDYFDAIIDIDEELGIKRINFEPRFCRGYIRVLDNEKFKNNVAPIRYNQMDLLRITPHETDLRIEPYQDSIYWSTQYGYIKVFYSNGVIWELKSFERNGEVLYESKD